MGKREKKPKHQQRRGASYYAAEEETSLPSSLHEDQEEEDEELELEEEDDNGVESQEEEEEEEEKPSAGIPSKFQLYQQSVQSPKGDISYLQKFFLMYVGGRTPLHFQEDFCGTALLSTEWLRSDPRRTAIGLDFDLEALNWCMENNINKIGADVYSRISLFHGNVLRPLEAELVNFDPQELVRSMKLEAHKVDVLDTAESSAPISSPGSAGDKYLKKNLSLPGRDIVCAFNYSCCCLHKRAELLLYFKHARDSLSKKGGIFVMDLYGGTSSEQKIRLQRRFPNFTYIWEQAEFDIIERKTRISLHYHLLKPQKKIRHAFSYSWRLWSLPEIRDCLEEAGFQSIHFWLREMPDTSENRSTKGFGIARDLKYEEVESFQQHDAWNAYVVGVVH